ncbi:TPA: hypothetical protein ACQ431_003655, partial [Citrobacter murliniae]
DRLKAGPTKIVFYGVSSMPGTVQRSFHQLPGICHPDISGSFEICCRLPEGADESQQDAKQAHKYGANHSVPELTLL